MPLRAHAAVVALFAVLTVLATWPLASAPHRLLLGTVGDSLVWPWNFVWLRRALLELHQSPFFGNFAFQPYPSAYLHHTHTFFYGMLYLLGSFVVDNPFLWRNIFIFMSYVVAGYGTFLLARRLSGDTPGALIAGVAFAFCSSRMIRVTAHMNILSQEWVPLYLYFLVQGWTQNRRRDWLGAALCFVASVWNEYYHGLMIILTTLLFLACVPLLRPAPGRPWRERARASAGPIAVVAVLVLPLAWGLWQTVHRYEIVPFAGAREFFASPLAYLLPSSQHRLLHEWLWPIYNMGGLPGNEGESVLFLGYAAFVLALAGWVTRCRRRSVWQVFLLIATVFYFLLSLGPEWKLGSTPDARFIPLPYHVLSRLPFFADFRVPARFGLMVVLLVAVQAAFGWSALTQGATSGRRVLWAGLVILFIMLEHLHAPYRLYYDARDSDVVPLELTQVVREDPIGGTVLTFPFYHEDWVAHRLQIFHRQPAVTGILARPREFQHSYYDHLDLMGWFESDPTIDWVWRDPTAPQWLRTISEKRAHVRPEEFVEPWTAQEVADFLHLFGIRFLMFPPGELGERLAERLREDVLPIEVTLRERGAALYVLRPQSGRWPLRIDGGRLASNCFFAANFADPVAGSRWMVGPWGMIVFRIDEPADLDLEIAMGYPEHLPAGVQRLRVLLNGREVGEDEAVPVGWSSRRVTLPVERLRPGYNYLRLEVADWRSPKEMELSEDGRPLSLLVASVTFFQSQMNTDKK